MADTSPASGYDPISIDGLGDSDRFVAAFIPSVLSNVGRLKVGDVEFELRESVRSANTQNFVCVSDLSSAYQMTSQGDAGGFQTILTRALERLESLFCL